MRPYFFAAIALVLLCSHDMFLRFDTYFFAPETDVEVMLYNGTFEKSGNPIRRKRMADVSLVMGGKRMSIDSSQWYERDSATVLRFTTGAPGTYVAGVSLNPWEIEMEASKFNDYLASDGGDDMLEMRRRDGLLEQDAVEQYSKHAKTMFQVGDQRTDDWSTPLGYHVEFMPLSNPYHLHPGDELEVRLLHEGKPLANQVVIVGTSGATNSHDHQHADGDDHTHADASTTVHAHDHAHSDGTEHSHEHAAGHEHSGTSATEATSHAHDHAHADGTEHSHAHTDEHEHAGASAATTTHDHDHQHSDGTEHSHAHTEDHEHAAEGTATSDAAADHVHDAGTQYRTDADGLVSFPVTDDGLWHVRTIHMTTVDEPGLTHESNWATLTFEVSHDQSHANGAHNHAHDHEHEGGIPSYVYWLGSLALIGGLFYFFSRKR